MEKTKRIFNFKTATHVLSQGAELLEIRSGEIKERSYRQTFIFKDDEKLSAALKNNKK